MKWNLKWLVAWGASAFAVGGAELYSVRVEEPTGLYRRTGEVVVVPLSKLGGHTSGFTVSDEKGNELPWQATSSELLFPASLMPGELPVYRVQCCTERAPEPFKNTLTLRRIGQKRLEFGNQFFRAVLDLGAPAIVEAYSLRTASHRMLNMVETTPEDRKSLAGDLHEEGAVANSVLPPPVPGVPGPNVGWTTLGGKGPITGVEMLERGPMRGRVRLSRENEVWELTWTSGGAWFRWQASKGFRFASISASPHVPFNRCVGGSEYETPSGPGSSEPTPNRIALHDWKKLPGGHIAYYQREENYGALGIVALDAALNWTGACTRRLQAEVAAGPASIAITFPEWKGSETVLEARKENRLVRQPLLVQATGPEQGGAMITAPAAREPNVQAGNGPATPFAIDALSLDGDWELAHAEKGEGPPAAGWRVVKVPGTAHVQWLDPKLIYSREAEWISAKEWWYRKTIQVPQRFKGKRLRLQFGATDYYADTYVNGRYVGRHEGYIDPYEYDVTGLIKPGSDAEIQVRVWTPVDYYWRHRPYTVKGSYGAVDQKPDDITALGITRPVRLVASAGAVIRDVAVDTRLTGGSAEVEVQLAADGKEQDYIWELTLSPRNFTSDERIQVRAAVNEPSARLVIPVPNPQLWWTRDHGKPNLYQLEVRLLNSSGAVLDGQTMAVGIREIEKIGWDFYLNGKRMFIRGTNYYYNLYMSEMDRAKYDRDLQLMLGMNINMIRLHCHFSNPEFYELADENGVLIWQDYLEAWYPHDRGFAQRSAELYDNHIRYARNHPSVALWATSDEEDFGNYTEITKHLAPRAAALDPQRRPVVRSTGRFGDAHVYHGWYDGSLWDYRKMDAPFVSELGATSLPNYETLVKYMPGQWPIDEHKDEWVWRRLQIPEAMRAWGKPGSMTLQEYVPQTQAYVSRLFQIALERQRQRKGAGAGGILHFHAIDIWPSVTMAAIDFDRVPTKVYDTVRRSFEPVAALFEYDRDRWKPSEQFRCGLWAVNDRWDAVPGATLRWRVLGPGGKTYQSGAFPVSLPPDSVGRLGEAQFTAQVAGAYQLRAEMLDAFQQPISENIFEFAVRP
jgi:beta-mannosidase